MITTWSIWLALHGVVACSGNSTTSDTDVPADADTDTDVDADTDIDTDTDTDADADTDVETGDTAPLQVIGQWPVTTVGPMPFFTCVGPDGNGRGPGHLYDGQRTVLHFNPDEEREIMYPFQDVKLDFDALQAKIIVIRDDIWQSNQDIMIDNGLEFEVWEDVDDEVADWYIAQEPLGPYYFMGLGPPMTFLLDETGTVILVYSEEEVRRDDGVGNKEGHAQEVLDDAIQLWAGGR